MSSVLFVFETKVSFDMDALVAQYTRPAFENEGYSCEEQQELLQTLPPLSLKFALPPLENVRIGYSYLVAQRNFLVRPFVYVLIFVSLLDSYER